MTEPIQMLGPTNVPLDITQEYYTQRGAHQRFIDEMLPPIWREAGRFNVPAEIGAVMANHETGGGRFGGVVSPSFHNMGGIKKRAGGDDFDPDAHERFIDWGEGAAALMQYLRAYADQVYGTPIAPRVEIIQHGVAPTLREISGPGRYNENSDYGPEREAEVRALRAFAKEQEGDVSDLTAKVLERVQAHGVEVYDARGDLITHGSKSYPSRSLSNISQVTIHHTGAGNGSADQSLQTDVDRFNSHARFHVNDRDWPGIGYTFGISPAGRLLGMNDLDRITWHAGPDCNPQGIGVGVQRGASGDGVTDKILYTLSVLLYVLTEETPELSLSESSISAHRRCMPGTECPGNRLYQYVQEAETGAYKELVPVREKPDSNAYTDPETDVWIINSDSEYGRVEMLDYWRDNGEVFGFGRPLEGMLMDYPYEGVPRFYQLCENALMECWPVRFGDREGPVYRTGGIGRQYMNARRQIAELEDKLEDYEDCGCAE